MKSPYGICEDHRTAIEEKILNELDRDAVVKAIRRSLDEHCNAAIDQTTNYLSDEYALVIEDIAKDRAKRMVVELLKGNEEMAQFFALRSRLVIYGADAGKPFVYDPEGVRAAIVERYRDSIASAEMIALMEENKRLREALKVDHEMRRY